MPQVFEQSLFLFPSWAGPKNNCGILNWHMWYFW